VAPSARLFDLDGTLWDSFPFYASVLAPTLVMTEEEAINALRSGEPIVRLMRRVGLPRTAVEGALVSGSGLVVPWAGVRETIDELRRRNHPLGVVTALPGSIASAALQRLGLADNLPVVIHAGSGVPPKPSPAPLFAALAQLGVTQSSDDLYVGDAPTDATAARRARMRFAWASWGYGAKPDGVTVLEAPAKVLDL
jgi:phosphoglycolate phosphatase-like HAD superfamily hydrolase